MVDRCGTDCQHRVVKYRLLKGKTLDLSTLSREDLAFLVELGRRAMGDEDYGSLRLAVCGRDAYPLKGGGQVTGRIHMSPLYRVAEDIVDRVGIRQGLLGADPGDRPTAADEIVGVGEAAKILGVSRSAVHKAASTGRLRGRRIGRSWALLRGSVEHYQVSAQRVQAGRARRSHRVA